MIYIASNRSTAWQNSKTTALESLFRELTVWNEYNPLSPFSSRQNFSFISSFSYPHLQAHTVTSPIDSKTTHRSISSKEKHIYFSLEHRDNVCQNQANTSVPRFFIQVINCASHSCLSLRLMNFSAPHSAGIECSDTILAPTKNHLNNEIMN